MSKICDECGADFSGIGKRFIKRRFCSATCSSKNNGKRNAGRVRTQEFKDNHKIIFSGERNYFYGKKHTEESLLKISRSQSMVHEGKVKYCNMTAHEIEVFDGLLLGDGHITKGSRISSRLSFGFKYKETCDEIVKALPSVMFSKIRYNQKNFCWEFKSMSYGDLHSQRDRWYINGRKIVPQDVAVTPMSCYWWYIGDGYVSEKHVYLCTDSFTTDENLFLLSKLMGFGYTVSLRSTNRIAFFKKSIPSFLKWISPIDGVMDVYKYKWAI